MLFLNMSVYVSRFIVDTFINSSASHHSAVNILCLICLHPAASFSPQKIITGQGTPQRHIHSLKGWLGQISSPYW